jgi:hypothetical protein
MGHLENKLKRSQFFLRVWVRYVCDVFAVAHKDGVLDLLTANCHFWTSKLGEMITRQHDITARLNGYARVPIEKLAIKHSNWQRIRQISTLTPLEKEAQKYASIPYPILLQDYQQGGQHFC